MKGHASVHLIGLLIASLRGWVDAGTRAQARARTEAALAVNCHAAREEHLGE